MVVTWLLYFRHRVREFEEGGGSGQDVSSVAREISSNVTDPSIQATEVQLLSKIILDIN